MLIVSKSLCGFVANQVQYNMKSTEYLGLSYYIIVIYIYIYIYIYINTYILVYNIYIYYILVYKILLTA